MNNLLLLLITPTKIIFTNDGLAVQFLERRELFADLRYPRTFLLIMSEFVEYINCVKKKLKHIQQYIFLQVDFLVKEYLQEPEAIAIK
jgi:hypothetical protein